MLTCEEWEEFREVRSRTPFESKLACSNALIRTEEPVRMEDLKGWTIDVLSRQLHETPSLRRVYYCDNYDAQCICVCTNALHEGKVQIKLYAIFQ
ncbi:hypothetical protein Peur_002098 [Populus x canadensis]